MKVKNISGVSQYFRFGKKGLTLSAGEIAEVGLSDQFDHFPSEEKAYEDAVTYETQELIEIVEAPTGAGTSSVAPRNANAWVKFGTIANGNTVTLGTTVRQFTNTGAATGANIPVTLGGNNATSITNLLASVNELTFTTGVKAESEILVGDTATFYLENSFGASGNAEAVAVSTTVSGSTTSGATFAGGVDGQTFRQTTVIHTVTAGEESANSLTIATGLPSVSSVVVSVVSSAGLSKLVPTTSVFAGGTVRVSWTSGDIVATDVITLQVLAI